MRSTKYKYLSEAVEDLSNQDYEMAKISDDGNIHHEAGVIDPQDLNITATYQFNHQTSAADEATLYVVEGEDFQGYLTTGPSWRLEPAKAHLLDRMLSRAH